MRLVALVVVLGMSGASRTGAQPPVPDHFRPLEFLAGSCWAGSFPDGKSTDEHCFEWVFDGKFIRDRHVVRGRSQPYAGETIFAWDAKDRRVVFWYWNSRGGFSTGHVEYTDEGIVFPERHTTEKGVQEMKAVWKRAGPDAYRVHQAERAGNEWKTLWTMELKRRG
jgi:hypothetical protein